MSTRGTCRLRDNKGHRQFPGKQEDTNGIAEETRESKLEGNERNEN
jgi:hypothetical protein